VRGRGWLMLNSQTLLWQPTTMRELRRCDKIILARSGGAATVRHADWSANEKVTV